MERLRSNPDFRGTAESGIGTQFDITLGPAEAGCKNHGHVQDTSYFEEPLNARSGIVEEKGPDGSNDVSIHHGIVDRVFDSKCSGYRMRQYNRKERQVSLPIGHDNSSTG